MGRKPSDKSRKYSSEEILRIKADTGAKVTKNDELRQQSVSRALRGKALTITGKQLLFIIETVSNAV